MPVAIIESIDPETKNKSYRVVTIMVMRKGRSWRKEKDKTDGHRIKFKTNIYWMAIINVAEFIN